MLYLQQVERSMAELMRGTMGCDSGTFDACSTVS